MPAGPHQIKFKPEIVDKILDKISKHIPYKVACLSSGVNEKSFYLWKEKGEKDLLENKDTPHAKFVERLSEIEANRMEYHINQLQYQENGHKGAQWVLERVYWKYYSPKVAEIELNERVEALEKQKGVENDKSDSEEKENLC